MKIAIIDCVNQDIGLKILYPEADYYIYSQQSETRNDRLISYDKYNIIENTDIKKVNSNNYDILFILCSLYDSVKNTPYYKDDINTYVNHIHKIINENNFKKIYFFDNYDYDYDPNTYFENDKVTLFFKRNYNKNKVYKDNVISFPFIMFGYKSLIEKIDTELVEETQYLNINKQNRLFFAGSLFNHVDKIMNVYRDRRKKYDELRDIINNPGYLYYDNYLRYMRDSKFSLDLLGVGEPNKRTIEILISGSLLILENSELKWPFDEEFSEYTQFKSKEELKEKLKILNDENVYKECLNKQYDIVKKYFNVKWLRQYIDNYINM